MINSMLKMVPSGKIGIKNTAVKGRVIVSFTSELTKNCTSFLESELLDVASACVFSCVYAFIQF